MRGKLIEQITALFFQFGFHYCNIVFFERWVGRARNSQGQGIRKVLNQQSRSTTFIWKRKGTLTFLPIKSRLSLKMDFRAQLRPLMLTLGNERVNECIIQIRTYIVLRADTNWEVTEGLESEMAKRALQFFFGQKCSQFYQLRQLRLAIVICPRDTYSGSTTTEAVLSTLAGVLYVCVSSCQLDTVMKLHRCVAEKKINQKVVMNPFILTKKDYIDTYILEIYLVFVYFAGR